MFSSDFVIIAMVVLHLGVSIAVSEGTVRCIVVSWVCNLTSKCFMEITIFSCCAQLGLKDIWRKLTNKTSITEKKRCEVFCYSPCVSHYKHNQHAVPKVLVWEKSFSTLCLETNEQMREILYSMISKSYQIQACSSELNLFYLSRIFYCKAMLCCELHNVYLALLCSFVNGVKF